MFHFLIKLRAIEPLLHFYLHFCSKKRLWFRLFTIIGTFSKNLKCLLERFLVCWRILKNLFKDTRVIWSSDGRILVSRSRSLAVSYLVFIKQTFIPQFICLLILSIEYDGKFWKKIALKSKWDKTSDLKRFILVFSGTWWRTKYNDLIAEAILLITLFSWFWYVSSLSIIIPKYLHFSDASNRCPLKSTVSIIGNFSFLNANNSVFFSFKVNLFCFIYWSVLFNVSSAISCKFASFFAWHRIAVSSANCNTSQFVDTASLKPLT